MSIMPVTWWQRLEPRPRTNSIRDGLAARVRDPLWMLGRQWQVGEFHGEDTGTPCRIDVKAATSSPKRASGPGWVRDVREPGDLERETTRTWLPDSPSTAAELGDVLRNMLEDVDAWEWFSTIVDELELRPPSGVGLDGTAAWLRAEYLQYDVLPAVAPETWLLEVTVTVLDNFVRWGVATFGPPSDDTGPWRPEHLDYMAHVEAHLPNGRKASLAVRPDSDARIDWYSLELDESSHLVEPTEVAFHTCHRPPMRISFPGIPHRRWWRFEEGKTALPQLKPDKRDLAMLLMLDFALVAGDDWFVVPLQLPWDEFASIVELRVTDVFGEMFGSQSANRSPDWQFFSLHSAKGDPVDALFTGGPVPTVDADANEKLRYLRDEVDNLVWAIEDATGGDDADGISRHVAATTTPPEPRGTSVTAEPLMPHYVVEHPPPIHWWPFAAVRGNGATRLVPAQLPDRTLLPLARDLAAYGADKPLFQHAVSRSGVRVTRVVRMSRTTSGEARLIEVHTSQPGAGDERSGLAFDILEAAKNSE